MIGGDGSKPLFSVVLKTAGAEVQRSMNIDKVVQMAYG